MSHSQSPNVEENQPKNEVYPQSLILEHAISQRVQDPTSNRK